MLRLNKTRETRVLRRPSYSKNSKRITKETPRIQNICKDFKKNPRDKKIIQNILKKIQTIPK